MNVILFYPSSNPDREAADIEHEIPGIPIGILSLASYLNGNGVDCQIIDARIYSKKESLQRLYDLLKLNPKQIIGFSVTTSQIRHALNISTIIKERFPESVIVWGGIHCSLYPEQVLSDWYVDYVFTGEAEVGLLSLSKELDNEVPDLSSIPNLVYYNLTFIHNPLTHIINMNTLPPVNYSLLDMEKYINRSLFYYGKDTEVRGIDICTSRGCPYRCSFCTNTMAEFKRWRPLSAERVNALIDSVIEKYHINHIWFTDDYFFGSQQRVYDISTHLNNIGYKGTWEANARVNLFNGSMDDAFLNLLKRSGCTMLRMGIESGDNDVLTILKKDISIPDVIAALNSCDKYNIRVALYFMGGIPGETRLQFYKTVQLMKEIKDSYPNSIVQGPGLFRPYPGTELYKVCIEKGFNEPTSNTEWAESELTSNYGISPKNIYWTDFASEVETAELTIFNYVYYKSNKSNPVRFALYLMAKLRLKFNMYNLPIEKWLFNVKKRLKI